MENRHALVVDTRLTQATGTAEREAALAMVAARPGTHRITLDADKARRQCPIRSHASYSPSCDRRL